MGAAKTDRWELTPDDEAYPACLLRSPRPPKVLYGVGDPAALREGLAVVGARKATPYGLVCAKRFAGWAAANGVTIVSGAAIGCDSAAHRAALAAGGATVAVLGCGADVDYPRSAAPILAEIRRRYAVVSELPWGDGPRRNAFPARNRIIAALARAVLVVEAAVPSGTFSTVEAALEAGRDVLAVPGSVFAPECRGPNRLIRQGAPAVTEVSELAAELRACGLVGADERPDPEDVRSGPCDLSRALLADPMRPDDAAYRLGLDIVEVVRRLSALEAAGVVKRYRDGRYGPG